MQAMIVKRHAKIRQLTTPLPGSAPYDNYRPLNVPKQCDGMTLLDTLVTILPVVPREEWLVRFENRRLLDKAMQAATADQIRRGGDAGGPGRIGGETLPGVRCAEDLLQFRDGESAIVDGNLIHRAGEMAIKILVSMSTDA